MLWEKENLVMIFKMPSYCKAFCCLAGECRDSCCIGWEIDVDENTASYYDNVKGDFGTRLHTNITKGEVRSFRLQNERCPFLNEKNLCDIILTLGEDKLCHICAQHPRYFAWFAGLKEGGIGLCCEEAARLVLADRDLLSFWEREIADEEAEDYDEDLFGFLYSARDEIFSLLTDQKNSFGERVCSVLDYAKNLQAEVCEMQETDTPAAISDIIAPFLSLEAMDPAWKPALLSLCEKIPFTDEQKEGFFVHVDKWAQYAENLAVYFIYRYFLLGVFDGEILAKVKLAAVSLLVIFALWLKAFSEKGSLTEPDAAWIAKNYSKEIEYNEENLNTLFALFYENGAFGTENLKRFFQ